MGMVRCSAKKRILNILVYNKRIEIDNAVSGSELLLIIHEIGIRAVFKLRLKGIYLYFIFTVECLHIIQRVFLLLFPCQMLESRTPVIGCVKAPFQMPVRLNLRLHQNVLIVSAYIGQ